MLPLVAPPPPQGDVGREPRLGTRAPDDPDEQREVEQRDATEQRGLELERVTRRREDLRARTVEDDRPLRDRRAREREHVTAVAVEAGRVGEHAVAGLAETRRLGDMLGLHEAREDRLVVAIEDRETGVAEVERRLARVRGLDAAATPRERR